MMRGLTRPYAGLAVYGFAAAGVPVAIAILRHHLYDIDRIVSNAIGYSLVSGPAR